MIVWLVLHYFLALSCLLPHDQKLWAAKFHLCLNTSLCHLTTTILTKSFPQTIEFLLVLYVVKFRLLSLFQEEFTFMIIPHHHFHLRWRLLLYLRGGGIRFWGRRWGRRSVRGWTLTLISFLFRRRRGNKHAARFITYEGISIVARVLYYTWRGTWAAATKLKY